uniref:Uncharacterized protein n=1 Tax=Arundo donax TaxID=35708 RepID=A0A0A9HN26_ARUDO
MTTASRMSPYVSKCCRSPSDGVSHASPPTNTFVSVVSPNRDRYGRGPPAGDDDDAAAITRAGLAPQPKQERKEMELAVHAPGLLAIYWCARCSLALRLRRGTPPCGLCAWLFLAAGESASI